MASSKTKAPEQTFEEVKLLRRLVDNKVPVRIRLTSDEDVAGTIEFFDESFLRLTRVGEPNLFVYKHEVKYLWEVE
ncbi:MAG: hypothetical protein SGI92_04995 [Bryobacteraceae bacterium]|nr:hypothetical protein [Bryobacteraceae bacterium]